MPLAGHVLSCLKRICLITLHRSHDICMIKTPLPTIFGTHVVTVVYIQVILICEMKFYVVILFLLKALVNMWLSI